MMTAVGGLAGEAGGLGRVERKQRERGEREERIVAAARLLAEREGWRAVTVRRLAEAVEWSQPVLYSHFANREAIVAAVAVEGFRELGAALRAGAGGPAGGRAAGEGIATAYLLFARAHPALYAAMFTLPTTLRFAVRDTPAPLREAFAALKAAIPAGSEDADTATETYWAALHGLAELERAGRIRVAARDARVRVVLDGLVGR